MRAIRSVYCIAVATMLLVNCGESDVALPGQRLDIRASFDGDVTTQANRAAPITLSRQANHASWTHRAGASTHRIQHPAFSRSPNLIWAADVGQASDRRHRITADPVSVGGVIFTLDSRATVTAISNSGKHLWNIDLTPKADGNDDASGGGLAIAGGILYAATGYGDLAAINSADGSIYWSQKLDGSVTGAPTVRNNIVYVVTRGSRGWAIDAADGRVRWQVDGTPSVAGIVGGSGPAVDDRLVIFPFGSTQLSAAFAVGGMNIWRGSVSGARVGRAYAALTDITGDPVIHGNRLYAGNSSGRSVAIDLTSGETLWTAAQGAVSPVWVEGGSVFLISDQAELVRLNASNGARIWGTQLPDSNLETKTRRRHAVFAHFGPVLAGGLLWVASGDGHLRGFDPVAGGVVTEVPLPAGASSRPIVVNGTMYLVSEEAQLLAFR